MISIITPTYNSFEKLTKTDKSIFSQSYTNIEWIVIDGKSTDSTVDYMQTRTYSDKRVRFISESDNGVYDAMNKGVKLADGEYVIVFGAGDVFPNDYVLEKVYSLIDAKTAPDILYGYTLMNKNGKTVDYRRKVDVTYPLRADPISHQAVFARKELFEEYLFSEKYKIAADQDWIMHMYKKRKTFRFIDTPICLYDMEGLSSSEEGYKLAQQEIRDIQKKYYPVLFRVHTILREMNKLFKIKRL